MGRAGYWHEYLFRVNVAVAVIQESVWGTYGVLEVPLLLVLLPELLQLLVTYTTYLIRKQ